MPLTPETLPRHELAGLRVRVAAADNPDLVGIEGTVVAETTQTLTVEEEGEGSDRARRQHQRQRQRQRQVPKAGTTFEFELPGGDHAVVEGDRLVARPARRTEHRGDSQWR
jgi:ribonuclease P protein subunit POP4